MVKLTPSTNRKFVNPCFLNRHTHTHTGPIVIQVVTLQYDIIYMYTVLQYYRTVPNLINKL